ncbi:hypothetical protein [Pseudomonas sp. K5]|uniref:hypothetical protein n=1 Tax=Pseudomonas sp. K5 TaxID=1156313 RepID=UPI001865DE2B|nr:hypothetical protein [Pseudomonas sp. K5]
MKLKLSLLCAVLMLALTLLIPMAVPAVSAFPVDVQAEQKRIELESAVSRELQRVLDKQPRLAGQSKSIHIQATIDLAQEKLTIVLDRGFVPTINGGELEDLQSLLTVTALHLTDSAAVDVGLVELLCDGRPLSAYFPEETQPSGK